jgi:hypothetical protein
MKHFEETALNTTYHKPAKWFTYVVDTCVVWSHETERLQQFLYHLNSIRPNIKFTIEVEANYTVLGRFDHE